MIKRFSVFNEQLDNQRVFENEYLIQNITLVSGSEDLSLARKFVKEMTKKEPPPTKNLGELTNFCIDNYYGFQYPEERGALKPQVDVIKQVMKTFFASTEVEVDETKWFSPEGDDTFAVDATFRNFRRSGFRGLLQRFFDTFWYIKTNTTETSDGLDVRARNLIKEIVQEIKEIWDPEGWDAYAWGMGGDSNAIKTFNIEFGNMYGEYAEALANLKKSGAKTAVPDKQPSAPSSTSAPKTKTSAAKPAQDWNRSKKLSFK